MDKIRSSINAKRPGKPKGHNTPFDLIPLGQKSGEASKSKLLAAAKTDASLSAGSSLLVKKAKYGVPNKAQMKYDEMATDCLAPELYDKIEGESEPSEVTDKLLCGAVKHLRAQRAKPNHQIVLTLMTLAKDRPSLFTTDVATGAFCSLLKRDASANFKAKGNPTVTVLACNLLYTAYADEEHWPQQLVEVYLEDSLGERTWVDRADCKPLVNNIVTAFGTNLTPKNPSLVESSGYGLPSTSGAGASSSPSSSPFHHSSSPVDTGDDSNTGFSLGLSNAVVKHRYRFQMDSIEQLVMDTVTEQMTKRQHLEVTSKQLLRLLTSVSGYCAARLMVVNKLDSWLQNPKLMKAAQDLLLAVCLNCSGQNPNDKDVIVGLLKIRAKTKPVLSHYINCIRELLEADDENLRIVLTHTVYNELSTSRHPNNMQMLATMFQQNPELSPKLLADIFIDLLMTKEDYLRSLRALLREIVRAMRTDFTFHAFCVGLMANRSTHPVYLSLEQSAKERVMYGIADLVAVTELLTISPAVKEALGGSVSFTDKRKDASVIQTFWSQIANIQKTSVSWMYETFTSMLHVTDGQGFIQCLYKLLMMAHGEHYSKVDNWPTEADRKIMLRLASETPVLEDTLLRLLMMGMDGEYPLKASDALDVMELMVNRAAALKVTNYPALEIKNLDIVKLLLNVSTYHHPDNIKLPKGYRPPHLAIASMFWKSWLLILVLVAYNPTTFGKYVWKEYPTLEMLMEMVMTNRYLFPPVSSGTDMEQLVAQERQICELEKQEILEFEGHLAAATSNVTITETNSLLLSQLISMNASGPSRKPPAKIVEELKMLNSSLHLGHTLSKSRNPDFLLQVIQKQGTSNAMPWLSELVESSEGSLDVLPIQCLCEFLLMSNGDSKNEDPKAKHSQKIARHDRLLQRLQMIMQQPSDSGDGDSPAFQVISYFFERLYSTSPYTRDLSVKALRTMFVDPVTQQAMDIDINTDSNQFDWLHVNIPEISMFSSVEDLIQSSVQKALHVETDYEVVSAYITYLMESKMYRKEPSLAILEISKMLCSRPALCNQLLSHSETYDMLILSFKDFTEDAIARKSAFEWEDNSYAVMVEWPQSHSVVLDMRIVHAVMELLSHNQHSESSMGVTNQLLELWFPESGDLPVGCMFTNSDLADLFTDSLRRKMLQTGNTRLISAALSDVTIAQLILYFQSFGLPVNAVNAILKLLDQFSQKEPRAVKTAAEARKQYLSQLLGTQRLRGVSEGAVFATILDKDGSEAMDTSEPHSAVKTKRSGKVSRTLSTLESRNVKVMDADLHSFVHTKLCNETSCKEGLMVAQHTLVTDPSRRTQFIQVLIEVMSGSDKSRLINALNSAPHLSAALLRLLGVKTTETEKSIASKLFEMLRNESVLSKTVQSTVKSVCSKLSSLSATSLDNASAFSQQMVNLCVSNKRAEAIETCIKQAYRIQRGQESKAMLGLIIDWLELLDPEIDNLCTELQDKMLFGQGAASTGAVGGHASPQSKSTLAGPAYLRSLLTHQARWSTIRKTIDRLLSADRVSQWTPSSVLDFLAVCISHPKLYQGREQRKPKKSVSENVLCLTREQTQMVAHLICLEGESLSPSENDRTAVTSTHRVQLLLDCCIDESVLHSLVLYLESQAVSSYQYSINNRRLLVSLYTQRPEIIHWLGDPSILQKDMTLVLNGSCTLDSEIHSALSTLGRVKAGKKYAVSSSDATLACRKLASLHPLLFHRHVSMMSSLLGGRAQFVFGEFLHRNMLLLHTNILGLVELLQPHIYLHPQFPDIVESYFNVIKIHGTQNDDVLAALIIKFIAILCKFFSCLPDLCIRTISQYKDLLNLLQNDSKYNKNQSLKSLATATCMPQAIESPSCSDLLSGGFVLTVPSESNTFTSEQMKATLRKLGKDSPTEDILSALGDLEQTSKKVIDVLSHCLDEFKRLILSLNKQIRESTFKLITRYCRHNPRVATDFLTPVLACLEHDNTDISATALTYVADLALLLFQDDRQKMLDVAFKTAALRNSADSIKSIKQIVRVVSTNVFSNQT